MIELRDDNWKLLPKKVQKRVNDFLEHLKEITWFRPKKDLKRSDVDKQTKLVLECFWIEAEVEYKKLETKEEWKLVYESTRDSDWDLVFDSVWDPTWDLVWDLAFNSIYNPDWALVWVSAKRSVWDLARITVWDLAWISARTATELLVIDNKDFKKKYPNWVFTQLFKLWEMGLYPVWILEENNKFVIYANPKYCLKKNWRFK